MIQIINAVVDIPIGELDLHNLLNTGGIAFMIWFMKRMMDRVDSIDIHMKEQDVQIAEIKTELRIRNEDKE